MRTSDQTQPNRRSQWRILLGLGLAVFGIMFAYWTIYFSSVGNRNPANGNFVFLVGIPAFPLGFAKLAGVLLGILAPTEIDNITVSGGAFVPVLYCGLWLLYAGLPLLFVAIKSRRRATVILVVLALLLAANMAGCVLSTPDVMIIH